VKPRKLSEARQQKLDRLHQQACTEYQRRHGAKLDGTFLDLGPCAKCAEIAMREMKP
jgi:hypothetical protein